MSEQIQNVAITGATGLVGTALSQLLVSEGKSVTAISRREGGSYQDTIKWDPESGLTNPARLETVDAVVHLAGENIAGARWNDTVKRRILGSRVNGTRSLVQSIAAVENKPKVLVSASAIGIYGDQGDRELTESSDVGSGFLADVCRQWEEEANAAVEIGLRVVNIRIGVVLSPQGGALAKMLTPFKFGLGGIVGSGKQYWSWIGLHDLTRVISYCLANEEISGPINAVSPQPLTNKEFTKDLGAVLSRPTLFPLPGFVAKVVLGEMAQDLLLASARVLPTRLQESGFEFSHSDLTSCLRHELQDK